MIKVFLIDDEPIIREGLRKTIDWGRLHCSVVGEAENGIEAIEKIKLLIPDIIITDIMMPGLNGLELTKHIVENHPQIKIIFLTGYNDFSFAQQAIKLGAFDFVLKPTDAIELENSITKAVDVIIQNDSKLVRQEELRKMLEASIPMLKDKFFFDLLYSKIDNAQEVNKKMLFFGIGLESFIIMAIEIDNYRYLEINLSEEEKYYYMFSIKKEIEELLDHCRLKNIISCNQNTFSVILQLRKEESEEGLKSIIISIAEELRKAVEEHYPFVISVGISHLYQEISDIKQAYKEAVLCLENKFYIGNNATIHIDDVFNNDGISAKNEIDTKPVMEAIRAGNSPKVKVETDNIIKMLSVIKNKQFIRNICSEIIIGCSRLYCETYGHMEDIFEDGIIPFEKILSCSAAELFTILASTIETIIMRITEIQNSQTRKVIAKAMDYIISHYSQDISLNDVADYVYLSHSYFSKLFKKESGETFSEFILKIRIEKAKEFLKDNIELKTYEVAEKVGFNDSRYFGQIFRKAIGMTPSEYRDSL